MKKIIEFFWRYFSSFFCKGKSWYVTKSKEIITMELQNELKLPPCRGCFCVQKRYFLELDGVTKVVSGYIGENSKSNIQRNL
jgi:peptide-methionine (S)-S-oxide reductase